MARITIDTKKDPKNPNFKVSFKEAKYIRKARLWKILFFVSITINILFYLNISNIYRF